jgi:hypothetical protein
MRALLASVTLFTVVVSPPPAVDVPVLHAARRAQERVDTYQLALECRAALWQATFDDATAAGLNPGAVVTSFDGQAVLRRDEDGVATLTGTEQYQPTTDVAPLPIRYECRVDLATGTVRALRYVAVDADGFEVGRAPTQLVQDGRLIAVCAERITARMNDEARRMGANGSSARVEIAPADVERFQRTGHVDLQGFGRGRYGPEYEWQRLVFSCRYDQKRQRATQSTHALETPSPVDALTAGNREALDACRLEIEDQVLIDAERRGSRRLDRVTLDLPDLATFGTRGALIDVSGKGQFKLDDRHAQPTPLSFVCAYDAKNRRLVSASFEILGGSWSPSGEIASGTMATLRCESRAMQRQECRTRIKGSVRIIRQLGGAACEQYTNWSWSPSGITVWDGCRAEFEYEMP